MSVILQIAGVVWTQGYSPLSIKVAITNSGTENVKDVKLKVTDSVVFDSLAISGPGCPAGKCDCLNVFSSHKINFTNGTTETTLAAGQTRNITLYLAVKAGAPVQVHNLTCDFQYATY